MIKVALVAHTVFSLGKDGPWATWKTDTESDAQALSEFAGRLCYQSWNNPSGRNNQQYLKNIISQGHFSVLEHAGFSVVITGISRSCTHELVRHRHFSFSQLSQRFYVDDHFAFVVPPLFRGDAEALEVLRNVHSTVSEAYSKLLEIAKKKTNNRKRSREAARCVLPNMTETAIIMTGNHRAWREFFEKRGSKYADAEIREVAVRIFEEIAKPLAPDIYQDFTVIGDEIHEQEK